MARRWIGGGRGVAGEAPLQNLFHGVEVVPGRGGSCARARELAGKRFLSEEAPLLPLEGCETPGRCTCVYRHYEDRRTDKRRDTDLGLPERPVSGDRRAENRGRRITDW